MSIDLTDRVRDGLPQEPRLLREVGVRLIDPSEQGRFDELLLREHYLKNATVVGRALRYVAEHEGQWLALLVFSSAAFHIKPRDRWLHWSARQVEQRRHLLAQNQRFLVLAAPGRWPNLASRILKLTCDRLAADWRQHFGHPVLAVETFVDPQRFRGTCYKAAGWQRLGPTQGCQRDWQDFYTDTKHPKEIWVRALSSSALEQLRAAQLPASLVEQERPLPPACPVATDQLPSLWQCLRDRLTDPRKPKGKRHQLATVLTLIALAVTAGCKNPHAVAEFARSLNHGQRRHLRCRPRPGTRRQCDVPGERTFRRLLKAVGADSLKDALVVWMAQQDALPAQVLHLDGKVVKNARPAPACAKAEELETEIPVELQKPKADKALTLVNFVTGNQRLVEQVAVPQNTNEEAAVAAHLPKMDLRGVCVTADAAHTTRANARQLTQGNGADYLMSLKGNQPLALAKAQQLLTGAFPPCRPDSRKEPRSN
jgi:Druantia protein DruA/DDE_Tnp_1-associated